MNDVQAFRALHARDRLLVLPNAWDAATAAMARELGAEAIITTSAGVAWACGYPDGDALPHDERVFAIRNVKRAAGNLPVSVDFESGFSSDPNVVATSVGELRRLGVAGINLEDGGADPRVLEQKIVAIKRALKVANEDIFINARTDVYLERKLVGEAAVRESIERARRYAAAGADGIFVPALSKPEEISAIAAAIALPLNLMAVPGLPSARELFQLGARRLSAGSALAELGYGVARQAARSLLEQGGVDVLFSPQSVDYGEMNALFIRPD